MALIQLFWKSADAIRWRFLVLVLLSAGSNTAVMMLISAVGKSGVTLVALRNLILFGLAIAIFVISQRRMLTEVSSRIEAMIHDIRVDLLERARASEVLQIDEVGRADLYNALSRATQVISQVTPNLVIAMQSVVLLSLASCYIMYLSPLAFGLWFCVIGMTIGLHLVRFAKASELLSEVTEEEGKLLSGFSDVFDGFRELKVSSAKMVDVSGDIKRSALNAQDKKVKFQHLFAKDYTFSTTSFFLMAGLMAFVIPVMTKADTATSTSLTMASLFMLGPVGSIAYSLSLLQQASAAAREIAELQVRLVAVQPAEQDFADTSRFGDFQRLEMRGVSFRYEGRDGERVFHVGPIDLELRRGEVVFITGGNGSGKTTLVSLLLDLYPPTEGSICLDGVRIEGARRIAYRDLFAVIFSGSHLFSRIYGLRETSDAEAADLIRLLELESKVSLRNGAFSTTKLSAGQRKRLSLIAAMLERKPVYVFDEWAADQDPYFRAKFYNEIIPRLKAAGSTVIAITHDDKYFNCADRRFDISQGLLSEVFDEQKTALAAE